MGDIAEGSKFWSLADFQKRELARLYKQNNAWMQTWKFATADVKIHCMMRGGQPVAFIYVGDSVYMESGFLFHRSIFKGNSLSYTPSVIRLNDFVSAKTLINTNDPASLLNASKSRRVADEDESLAVGCTSKIGSIQEDNFLGLGEDAVLFSEPPAFCPDIRKLKVAQIMCPPSVFTGKLRLMMQAIYGSRRRDYYYDEFLPRAYPYLIMFGDKGSPPLTLRCDTITSGLHKDPGGTYWVISMGGDEIRARKMQASEEVLRAISKMSDPLNEAYILGSLVPVGEDIIIGTQSLTRSYTPIAYGWKFNNTGSECSVVEYAEKPNLLGIDIADIGIETRLVTVVFGYNADTKTPIVSESTIKESGTHAPYYQSSIFTPLYEMNVLTALVTVISSEFSTMYDLRAPIYCYYDKDDKLIIIRALNGKETIVGHTVSVSGNAGFGTSDNLAIQDTEIKTTIDSPGVTTFDVSGFTVDTDVFFTGGSVNHNPFTTATSECIALDDTLNETYEFTGASPMVRNNRRTSITAVTRFSTLTTQLSRGYRALLIIPFGDAESVVLVMQERKVKIIDVDVANISLSGNIYEKEWWTWHPDPITFQIVWDSMHHVEQPHAIAYTWSVDSYAGTEGVGPNPAFAYSGFGNSTQQTAAIFRSSGEKLPVYSAEGSETANLAFTGLYNVLWAEGYTGDICTVKTSYSGAMRWHCSGNLEGDQFWPHDSINSGSISFSNPVGWA